MPICLWGRIQLGWEMQTHAREDSEVYQIQTEKQANQTRRNAPQKWCKLPQGCDSRTLGAHLCVCPHVLYSFPPNKHFTCFTTACLCGNSFLQTWRAKAWSLTTGLVPRIWCSHCHDRPQSLAGNQRPALRSCRLRPPEISNSLFYLLPNTRSCAWCTARPNKPKHQSLEHRKVHCRASQREQVAPA